MGYYLKNSDKENIQAFIHDLRVLGYNWLDDDSRCCIEGLRGHNALDTALNVLENNLKQLSLSYSNDNVRRIK